MWWRFLPRLLYPISHFEISSFQLLVPKLVLHFVQYPGVTPRTDELESRVEGRDFLLTGFKARWSLALGLFASQPSAEQADRVLVVEQISHRTTWAVHQ